MTVSIMVVEDEALVALDISERLRGLGYAVPCMLSSGEDAVARAVELKPALVLMDIGLKGDMDGIEAAVQIRAQLNIPCVFITAYGDEKTFERAAAAQPCGYIYKPFDGNDLQDCVNSAILNTGTKTEGMKW